MSDIEQIALNAIRWRATSDNDGKAMAQGDRGWLLRYIVRLEDRLEAYQVTLRGLMDAIEASRDAATADVERAGSARDAFGNAPTLERALLELAAAEDKARSILKENASSGLGETGVAE